MYSEKDLKEEVHIIINEMLADGQRVPQNYVISSIMANHEQIEGKDKDFYVICARNHIRKVVFDVLRTYDVSETNEDNLQFTFPGMKHLMSAYRIQDKGESIVVPLLKLTHEERVAKRDQLYKLAESTKEHGDEMKLFDEMQLEKEAMETSSFQGYQGGL
jgi:hypothetical protein